jgi:hypothetical protein
MWLDGLVGRPWLVAATWGILSLFDFAATMLYSKAYRDFLNTYVTYEGGVEMNPAFEKDVRELRWFSPLYLVAMLSVVILLVLAGAWLPPAWFEAVAGAAVLIVLVTDLRHFENLYIVWALRKDPEALQGRLQQSYTLSQRRVAVGTLNTGLLFLFILLLTGRTFFLGGAFICSLYAFRHYRLANRQLPGKAPVDRSGNSPQMNDDQHR